MGMLSAEIPIIDMVGPHVELISRIMLYRSGGLVVVCPYLETKVANTVTREIISKYGLTPSGFSEALQEAEMFIRQNPQCFAHRNVSLS